MKHRYSTIAATVGLTLALIALSSKTAQTFSRAPEHSLQVISATLAASPEVYDGPCPVTIKFNGNITVKGKGSVKYTFVRSDGATGPVYTLDFDGEETKPVATTWTLSPPTFGGWEAIRILSPNELESGRAFFKGTCLKETTSQNNSQFIACPVPEARTEVTTPLPKPWWNTPQIGKLERVSVQAIGGNKTLVCEYWAYARTVSIMRTFPEGATDCSAEGNGFRCHTTDSAAGSAAEVAACKSTLQSGKVSWGGGTTWASGNIDKLCNDTKNARNTIACFQSNVEALGWAAAIDKCK